MNARARAFIVPVLLLASCGSLTSSPTGSPGSALAAAKPPSPVQSAASPSPVVPTAASPSPVVVASDCTGTRATTRQVVERLFDLSTSNDARAVSDCYARAYRDKDPNFAESAALWSRQGPATDLVITLVDVVNGCDRYRVTARMPNNPFWSSGQQFYWVGLESDRPRIFETGTGLVRADLAITRCQ